MFDSTKKLELHQRINKFKCEPLMNHFIYGCFGEEVDDEDFKQIYKYM